MPVIIGHSQVKYFAEYMDPEEYTVFAYPGYRTRQFLEEDVLKTVLPFHSVVVLVVGANDIGRGNPERVMTGIEELSEMVRQYSPSSTLLVSEILPRGQNLFAGSMLSEGMLQRWNWEAAAVNRLLHEYASRREDVEIIPQSDFHTTFGVHRRLLSRDGLHLSFTGTETFVSNVEVSVRNCIRATAPIESVALLPVSVEAVESVVVSSSASLAVDHTDPVLMHGPMLFSDAVKKQIDARSASPSASNASVYASVPGSVYGRTTGDVVVRASASVPVASVRASEPVSVSVSDPGHWQLVSSSKKRTASRPVSVTVQRQSVSSRKKRAVAESVASVRASESVSVSVSDQVQGQLVSSSKKRTASRPVSVTVQRQSVSSRKKRAVAESVASVRASESVSVSVSDQVQGQLVSSSKKRTASRPVSVTVQRQSVSSRKKRTVDESVASVRASESVSVSDPVQGQLVSSRLN